AGQAQCIGREIAGMIDGDLQHTRVSRIDRQASGGDIADALAALDSDVIDRQRRQPAVFEEANPQQPLALIDRQGRIVYDLQEIDAIERRVRLYQLAPIVVTAEVLHIYPPFLLAVTRRGVAASDR